MMLAVAFCEHCAVSLAPVVIGRCRRCGARECMHQLDEAGECARCRAGERDYAGPEIPANSGS